jgi:hypothetical protein
MGKFTISLLTFIIAVDVLFFIGGVIPNFSSLAYAQNVYSVVSGDVDLGSWDLFSNLTALFTTLGLGIGAGLVIAGLVFNRDYNNLLSAGGTAILATIFLNVASDLLGIVKLLWGINIGLALIIGMPLMAAFVIVIWDVVRGRD